MKHTLFKNNFLWLSILPLTMGILWLLPLVFTFDLPAHYNVGLEKLTSKDIEVWDLWFYFPSMMSMTIVVAILVRKVTLQKNDLLVFVCSTVFGQVAGITLMLLLTQGSDMSIKAPLGIVFVTVAYTIIVMPPLTLLFWLTHLAVNDKGRELMKRGLKGLRSGIAKRPE